MKKKNVPHQLLKKTMFYIKTWGCQMNENDSSIISTMLMQNKEYQLTNNFYEADILILNTCSIREKAQEKLFHQLGRWKKIKDKNKNIIIAVGGCVANQEGKKILKRTKIIDIIFGTQTLHKLPVMINKIKKKRQFLIDIRFSKTEKFNNIIQPKPINFSHTISIMEGCNKYCSFCIVPYTRGREISKPFDQILNEIELLSNNGVREIQLLGQNVNSYRYFNPNGQKYIFSQLLREISYLPKIYRIRFMTSNPMEFTDDIIEVYRDIKKVVSFLHLPIQSGSNKILKLMKRPYSTLEYETIIQKLKLARPNIQISSDFIVGFPGETDEDFQDTIDIISKINFDMSFSFIYSPRPGTKAFKLKDNISLTEKKKRLKILQKKIKLQTTYWNNKMINRNQKVLVENYFNKNKKTLLSKTENYRTVIFQGTKNMIGNIVKVKIISKKNNYFQGKYLNENIQ